MKLQTIFKTLFILLCISPVISCSDDDSPAPCRATEISMKLNGQLHTYVGTGWGIDMVPGGHELNLDFNRDLNGVFSEEYLILSMRYKKTGPNVMDELVLTRFDPDHQGEYNLVNGDFESRVKINRSTCFYATFSGKFVADGEEITVTDGIISWEYDEPFSE